VSFLHFASGLAVLAAVGHSTLSERLFLRPLRKETGGDGVFSGDVQKKLATAMFHMASLCWVTLAASMLLLEPGSGGYRITLHLFAAVFAISGLGNFWAVGKPHVGGVVLLAASLLVMADLYA
jgi:hypothetical protein